MKNGRPMGRPFFVPRDILGITTVAYQTYITEARIYGSRASNTSDRSYLLFTREAGMLYAAAKSVREERSKQRFALQEFSYVRATLIHGKAGWRIAGVEPLSSLYAHADTREARTYIRNIVRLLRRTIHGETPHPRMFDDVLRALAALSGDAFEARELVLTLRILDVLGYIAPDHRYGALLTHNDVAESAQTLTPDMQEIVKGAIDHALTESQL